MSATARKLPNLMTVAEFLTWPGDGTGRTYELVDGELRAQDPGSDAHGTVDANLIALVHNHLRAHQPHCRVVSQGGIAPRLRANWNYRVPELAVTCMPNRADMHMTPEPVLLIEVLSPSNRRDTWSNVPLYASVPSVMEILLVESEEIGAELLRRRADGSWPEDPESFGPDGRIRLESIGFEFAIKENYVGTHMGRTNKS